METITLFEPVKVIGFHVTTFPLGVVDAFDKLTDMLGNDRPYYGLSQMSPDGVRYIAAALLCAGDEKLKLALDKYTIVPGVYATKSIRGWQRNLNAIPHVFSDLLKTKGVDYTVPCVEWYKDDNEMLCMVKLANG